MHGVIHLLAQYGFMVWCSVKKKGRDNFTFTFTILDYSRVLSRNLTGESGKYIQDSC